MSTAFRARAVVAQHRDGITIVALAETEVGESHYLVIQRAEPDNEDPFDEAVTTFGDPLSILLPDPDHSAGEERYLVMGVSTTGRLLVVAFVERPPRTRIITARLATKRERHDYEEG